MVYEWLSGHYPFEGSSSDKIRRKRQIQKQHLSDSPPSLSDKFSDISPAIEEVVFKALAKKPKDRYPDVKAFAEALEQACRPTAAPWLSSRIGFAKALEQFHRLRTSTTQIWPAIHNMLRLFKQIRRFRDLSGNDVFFEERYPATPIHGKSGVYKSRLLHGCVVDATQMLLRDQGIDNINDMDVAEAVEYKGLGDYEELGTHEEKMPDALKKFGSIPYKWTKKGQIDDLKAALKRGYSIVSSIKPRSGYGRGLHVVVIDKIGMDSREDGPFVYIRDSRYDEPYKVDLYAWDQARISGDVIPDNEPRH
jgi:serine/threonine protein kinase